MLIWRGTGLAPSSASNGKEPRKAGLASASSFIRLRLLIVSIEVIGARLSSAFLNELELVARRRL
jgi:hypothetical protein